MISSADREEEEEEEEEDIDDADGKDERAFVRVGLQYGLFQRI